MRELRVTSVDADASYVICVDTETGDKFKIPADDRLRAAARGDVTRLGQIQIEMESALRPRDIQARIRSGATVEEVAAEAGTTADRVMRFAHPVLLERERAADLIRESHPMGEDGPALATLDEVVTAGLRARGVNPDVAVWDAWKADDGNWVGQVSWTAGHTENHAHWRFQPGAQGGTADALDNPAYEMQHPEAGARHQLQPVADPVEAVTVPAEEAVGRHPAEPEAGGKHARTDPVPAPAPRKRAAPKRKPSANRTPQPPPAPPEQAVGEPTEETAPKRARKQRAKPEVPGWEEVLLGVRSTPNQ
ncbi:MAG: septation protein SepH [Gordonia sp. (in: high G+C Gram-positive bacteria)]